MKCPYCAAQLKGLPGKCSVCGHMLNQPSDTAATTPLKGLTQEPDPRQRHGPAEEQQRRQRPR
jgi:hypothetical protein